MPRDNSFSDSDQETPMAREYTGGPTNFGIKRAVDGHDHYPTMVSPNADGSPDPDGEMVPTYGNCHYPEYENDDLMGY